MKETTKKSKTIESKELIDSMLFLKEKNLFTKNRPQIRFESVEEAEDSAKEDVTSVINDNLNSIKQDISDLQKKGYQLKLIGIKLIKIPLKTKIWLSTCSRRDLEVVFNILDSVSKKIEPLKKEMKLKELEKEAKEKKEKQTEKKKIKESEEVSSENKEKNYKS